MAVSSDLKVTFTEFESAETPEGNVVTVPWTDFVGMVLEQGFFEIDAGAGSEEELDAAKLKLPLIVPAEFAENTARKTKENVERVWMGALDFDELEEAEFREVSGRIQDEGLEALLYTTWGYPKAAPLFKFRAVVPFSRPVRKREWPMFWRMFNNLLGGLGDESCKDPNRGYFAPGVPKGTEEEFKVLHHFEGDALDVDKILSGVDTMSEVDLADISDVGKEHIDRDRVKRFAQRLYRSKHNEYVSWVGECMLKMLKGEPFAEKGERDNTAYKMAQDLGKEFVSGDADSISSLFAPSLSHMGSDAPSVGDVREKIQRAQREEQARRLKKERSKIAVERSFLESSGAPDDYDKAFVDAFCKRTGNGCSFDLFSQRLIIQRASRYYVFNVNGYWPYSKEEVPNVCRDLLKPAGGSLGVNIYNVSDKGMETPKSTAQLVHDYGVVAKKDEIRMWANASYYEESTQTMVEAPYPARPLKPKRHPEVDRWIDDVCGDRKMAQALREWLSIAPDLTSPLAMLVFIGKTKIGKTSFAKGVARLWETEDCTLMHEVLGTNFNTGLKQSPVLLADEELPRDFRGRVLTAKLRSFISANVHQVNEKNRNLVPLKGYFRTIAALNNRDKLEFGSKHSREDVEAIQARTLLIFARPKAKFNYELFVNQDAIAEHALYLQQNKEGVSGRFGITIQNEYADLIQDSLADDLFEWIMWFVETRKLEEEKSLPAFVAKGNVYVSTDGVVAFWTTYHKDKKEVGRRLVGQTLKMMGEEEVIRITTTMGVQTRYYCISNSTLKTYAFRAGYNVKLIDIRLMEYTQQIEDSPYAKIPKKFLPTEEDRKASDFAVKMRERILDDVEGIEVDEA